MEKIECLILENEYYTALEIKRLIDAYEPAYAVAAILENCGEFQDYINCGNNADLILCDYNVILSLRGFCLQCPVVLISEYERRHINLEGIPIIDYLLKPVTAEGIRKVLNKFERCYAHKGSLLSEISGIQ